MRSCSLIFLTLLGAMANAQGFSRGYPGSDRSTVCGLQNGDLLYCRIASAHATVTRLNALGGVVWSRDFAPNVDAVWGGMERPNGDLLCLVHVADSLNPGAFVNGIMHLTPGGSVVRLRAFTDLVVSAGNPMGSYLVPHSNDDSYHYVFVPSILNSMRVYHMSDEDDVITCFFSEFNTLPVYSLAERDGYLYGVLYRDMCKLTYEGSVVWWMQTNDYNRLMYQIVTHDTDLVVRFQYGAGPGNYRPGIARMDTARNITHNVVFDLLGTGDPDARLVRTDEGFMLFSSFLQNNPAVYNVYAFSCDAQLENVSALEDELDYSNFRDATATVGNGVALCGLDNTVSRGFLTSTGPGHDLSQCWSTVAIDTLALPLPTWSDVAMPMALLPYPSMLHSAPSVEFIWSEEVLCPALFTGSARPADDVQVFRSGDEVRIISSGAGIARCDLFDVMGRSLLYSRGSGSETGLHVAQLPCSCGTLRIELNDGRVLTRSVLLGP